MTIPGKPLLERLKERLLSALGIALIVIWNVVSPRRARRPNTEQREKPR
jgi:hypothetical protein